MTSVEPEAHLRGFWGSGTGVEFRFEVNADTLMDMDELEKLKIRLEAAEGFWTLEPGRSTAESDDWVS